MGVALLGLFLFAAMLAAGLALVAVTIVAVAWAIGGPRAAVAATLAVLVLAGVWIWRDRAADTAWQAACQSVAPLPCDP